MPRRHSTRHCPICPGQSHPPLSHSCAGKLDGPHVDATFFQGRSNVLSNFYSCSIRVFDVDFRSSEQAYQYRKAMHFRRPGDACEVLLSSDPVFIKRKTSGLQDPSWDRIKVQVMEEIALAKYRDVPEYRQKLRHSSPLIVEAVPGDTFWSAGLKEDLLKRCKPECWPGQNVMGQVHMRVRQAMLHSPRVVPAPMPTPPSVGPPPAAQAAVPAPLGSVGFAATARASGPAVTARLAGPCAAGFSGLPVAASPSVVPTTERPAVKRATSSSPSESDPKRQKVNQLCPLDRFDFCSRSITADVARHMMRHHLPRFLLKKTHNSKERCEQTLQFLLRLCSAAGCASPQVLLEKFQCNTWPSVTSLYPPSHVHVMLVEEFHAFLGDPLPSSAINLRAPNCVAALTYWANIVSVVRSFTPQLARPLVGGHSSPSVDVVVTAPTSLVSTNASSTLSAPVIAPLMSSVVTPTPSLVRTMETPRIPSTSHTGVALGPHTSPATARRRAPSCTVSRPPHQPSSSTPSSSSAPTAIVLSKPSVTSSSTTISYADVARPSAPDFACRDIRYYFPDGTPRPVVSTPSPTLIGSDSHFHLDNLSKMVKSQDIDELAGKLPPNSKFQYLVTSSCFPPFASRAELACIRKDSRLKVCVGLHPKAVDCWVRNPGLLNQIQSFVNVYPKVVALGEVGIDLTVTSPTLQQQQDFLLEVCRLAKEKRLPLVIHARDRENSRDLQAQHACIQTMASVLPPYWPVYKHCLRSDADAKVWLKKFPNTVFGIGTSLLMKTKAGNYRPEIAEAVKNLPLSSVVLESDAPYLHPEGKTSSGARRVNHPVCIFDVAKRIASLKNKELSEVLSQTRRNTAVFFKLT